jgi:hypothetical protein
MTLFDLIAMAMPGVFLLAGYATAALLDRDR